MPELIDAYWPFLLVAFFIGLAIAWFAFMANRRTSVTTEQRDVLDEGADRARRNEALISAPPAAGTAPGGSTPMATVNAVPAAEEGAGDDLTRIKGLGPKLAALLNGQGISQYAQIAAWDDAEIERIDAQLGRFSGRIRRDNWVEQASLLAKGDEQGFQGRFGSDG